MANTIRIPVPNVAYARVDLPEIDINDNPYEALENAVGGIGNALAEREALNDAELLAKFDADMHNTATTYLHESVQNGTAGPGLTRGLDEALAGTLKYWKSQTKKSKLLTEMDLRHAKVRLSTTPLGFKLEAFARAEGAVKIAGATMDQLAAIAQRYPDQIGAVRDQVRELRLTQPQPPEILAAQERKINEAYLRGLIATNPKLALETLRSRKGDAQHELGIPEPLREALEHEAERATELETLSHTAALEYERIALRLDTTAALADLPFDTGLPFAAYDHLRDAYKVDPKTGARLEAEIDGKSAAAIHRARRHNNVGRALAEGRAIEWRAEELASLDAHIENVANDGSGEAVANDRRVRMAIIAGRAPPKMQGHILKRLHATDPAIRSGGLRMLQRLEEADDGGGLTAWLPADQRATAHRFAALTAAGYADTEALKHLDAAKSATPSLEEARRHHFDTYVRMDDLIDAAGRLYNVEPQAIAEDDMQTLEHRSDVDAPDPQTSEFRPDRDSAPLLPVVERDRRGRVRFDELDPLSDDYDRGERVDETTGKRYPYVVGTIYTDSVGKRRVFAKKNLSGDPRLDANCHGYTLAGGEVWIEPWDAEIILEEDYYRPRDLRPGDIVVYRDEKGLAAHSARVTSVTPDGRGGYKVRVIGKRGQHDRAPIETDIDKQWPGADFRHRPEYRGKRYRHDFYRKR